MINNSNFLEAHIPKFHAISQKYDRLSYWKEQKRRCIEGYWVSGKWMPGTLYYYINFHTIRFEEAGAASRKIGRPWLRDIEWEKAYVYEEAMGFSGFSDDTLYTCDRKFGPEKERALKYGWITEDETKSKIYTPAREYLRRIHPTSLGKPLYYNQAKNVIDLECFASGTSVLMYNGTVKNVEDIVVGDKLMGPDSRVRNVLSTHSGVDNMYEVKSKRFDSYICNSKHQIALFIRDRINGKYTNGERESGVYVEKYDSISIEELIQKQNQSSFTNRFYLYQSEALNFEEETINSIDPYFLGYWLADGRSNTISVKSVDKEILDNLNFGNRVVNTILQNGNRRESYELKWLKNDNQNLYYEFRQLLYNKHIPQSFKTSSINDRLQLLAGLIDGDGCYDKHANSFDIYVGLNKSLAEDICFVARSCGFYSNITLRTRYNLKDTYEVIISGDIWNIPCKYKRKKAVKIKRRVNLKHSSFEINPVGIGTFYGIEVDSDNLFLLSNCVTVHNSRGGGKSYWSSALILHNFLFDGAYDYDIYLENKVNKSPLTSDTVVGAIESKYSDDLLKKVKVAIEHLPDKQIINSEIYPSPLYVSFSGSLTSGKTLSSYLGSVINHRTFMDDPLAANGTRPNRAFLEEVGFMNNLVEVWGALESTQASSDYKNLVIYGLGTGGLSTHGAVTYTKEIFYNPEEFNCLAFDDIWENKGNIGFFIPGTHTINKFKKGADMITDEVNAKQYIEEEIDKAKSSGNRRKFMAEIINKPLKPSDIFLTVEGNFFPIEDLRQQLGEIEQNKKILEASWKVQFFIKDGKVDWSLADKPVLRDFPHRRGDILDTAIEIWELPKSDSSGKPPFGRYLASLDPVDNDGGDDVDHSLLSGFILDSWTDKIVVEYTGRTKLAEDFYEQWRRCLLYYNAMCNYERNLKGFYPHMKNSNSLFLLCDEPEILKEKGLTKGGGTGNQSKGVHGSVPVINWGIELILSWLQKRAYTPNEEEEEEEDIVTNLQTLRSPALLQELIAYNNELNADRVSSLIYLMILREDRINLTMNSRQKQIQTVTANTFWDKAYKNPKIKYYKTSL